MPENIPKNNPEFISDEFSYLALGDSYTVGEGEVPEFTYPMQAGRMLKNEGIHFSKIKIIAKTGWTSGELLAELKAKNLETGSFDFVSLLIGVNNQYRGLALPRFKDELKELISISLALLNGNSNRLVLISIPDWGVTPFGHSSPQAKADISREIDAFNQVVKQLAADFNFPYLEITESYRSIGGFADHVVEDGLHPNRHIYAQWASSLTRIIKQAIHQ
ncbi:MAG: GDSL-type esterase/lipase family protein [Cyclobacterium sp.]|uniref:SGNH/GDSL hydrolase family protein n=1 Tax=unclassified Cyclobacterium TaxID=2615055 RepID=UPI0013D7A9E9|nr:GDSL-type esterase/lipase family protein [Cyclobacterium sp. SYSU L10401]